MKRDFVDISTLKTAICTESTDIAKRSFVHAANIPEGYAFGGFQPGPSPISSFRALKSRTAGGRRSRPKPLETRHLLSQSL